MIYFILAMLIVVFDIISKHCIASAFKVGQQKVLIKNVLSFTYVKNKGAAFGMFPGARFFFIAFTVIVFAAAAWYFHRNKPQAALEKIAISFVSGGAVGNFIDRVFLGYVRDFISADFIDFPVFNVADCFVCIGAALFVVCILFFGENKVAHEEE